MDDKLLSKVCFNMMTMAGFIMATSPTVYNFLFNLEDEFDVDEMETILRFAERSTDVENAKKLIEELSNKGKEENDG